MDQENKKVDCMRCKHFAVTWNPRFPRACKLYGFQGRELPSVTVLSSTGSLCVGYEEKPVKKQK